MLVSGSDDTSVKLWATKERKLEAGPAKSALVKSLQRLRHDSSDSDQGGEDEQMQEDYKSRGSDDYMSENEDEAEQLGWENLAGMRH